MKKFSLDERIYICKNANSKTLEDMANVMGTNIDEIKKEFKKMKADGTYDRYRILTKEEIEIMKKNNETSTEKNKLLDLNDYLFDQLKTLTDNSLSQEDLDREIKISKQVVSVSQTIINNANLLLQAKKHFDSTQNDNNEIAPLLRLN